MAETMHIVFEALQNYRGESLFFCIYLLAVLYLFLTEKEKNKRILLISFGITVLVIFVFPVTAYVIMNYLMDTEIYYRQLWLIPAAVTVSYAIVRMIMRTRKAAGKVGIVITALVLLIITGSNVFTGGNYARAENPYHIPQSAIDVCDVILEDDVEYIITAAFPQSLVEYTRQYTAEITTVYGREAIIDRWNLGNELLTLIESDTLDAEKLFTVGREQGAECIVLDAAKPMNGNPEDYNFWLVDTVDGYNIYMEAWLKIYRSN